MSVKNKNVCDDYVFSQLIGGQSVVNCGLNASRIIADCDIHGNILVFFKQSEAPTLAIDIHFVASPAI